MRAILDFLKKTDTYYIATIDDNMPRVRPFGTINLFDDKLWIQTGKAKSFYEQIKKNPNFELVGFVGSEWLRVNGTLVEDNRTDAQVSMLEAYPQLKNIYAVDDGNNVVFYLNIKSAILYSFGKEPQIFF
jgi:uncharacterized pyridoxamine 5'-phosphate oxidase family protein